MGYKHLHSVWVHRFEYWALHIKGKLLPYSEYHLSLHYNTELSTCPVISRESKTWFPFSPPLSTVRGVNLMCIWSRNVPSSSSSSHGFQLLLILHYYILLGITWGHWQGRAGKVTGSLAWEYMPCICSASCLFSYFLIIFFSFLSTINMSF